jgi:hypothetical protein
MASCSYLKLHDRVLYPICVSDATSLHSVVCLCVCVCSAAERVSLLSATMHQLQVQRQHNKRLLQLLKALGKDGVLAHLQQLRSEKEGLAARYTAAQVALTCKEARIPLPDQCT